MRIALTRSGLGASMGLRVGSWSPWECPPGSPTARMAESYGAHVESRKAGASTLARARRGAWANGGEAGAALQKFSSFRKNAAALGERGRRAREREQEWRWGRKRMASAQMRMQC